MYLDLIMEGTRLKTASQTQTPSRENEKNRCSKQRERENEVTTSLAPAAAHSAFRLGF